MISHLLHCAASFYGTIFTSDAPSFMGRYIGHIGLLLSRSIYCYVGHHLVLYAPCAIASIFLNVTAMMSNRTIDDSLGDSVTGIRPSYFPTTGIWQTQEDCAHRCSIQPDITQAFDGTYTAGSSFPSPGSHPISITLEFSGMWFAQLHEGSAYWFIALGTAIWIYFILANNDHGTSAFTTSNFTMDGLLVKTFTHNPESSTTPLFDQLVFSQTGMPSASHQLVISADIPMDANAGSWINFDRAVYT